MIEIEFSGLITLPPTKSDFMKFVKACDLMNKHSIKYRTRRDKNPDNDVITAMYIIFDDESDYSAYQLIKE